MASAECLMYIYMNDILPIPILVIMLCAGCLFISDDCGEDNNGLKWRFTQGARNRMLPKSVFFLLLNELINLKIALFINI